jgi:hypothetical protein
MIFDDLIQVIDSLSTAELEQLKVHIDARQNLLRQKAEGWAAALDAATDEFWGDSIEEEMREIFEAMSLKSLPSSKPL